MKRYLINRLAAGSMLTEKELVELINGYDDSDRAYAAEIAREISHQYFGNSVYIRGLIEISSFCKNNCYYCGLRRSNKCAERYRISKEQILECCDTGYKIGFRTFVMQGGEDLYYTDDIMTDIISSVKSEYPDCAVTLSLGEKRRKTYERYRDAGADRYLLRHETATKAHYEKLHPQEMSFENRMRCLKDLKELGFQTGCGFMVGSPYQTADDIARDLIFIHDFEPQMVGIGPFLPQKDTPFGKMHSGSGELTLFLLSIIRIMQKNVLLPATTALGTLCENGREQGILSGANVIMPNLSPSDVRKKYLLYDNKLYSGEEAAEGLDRLKKSISDIGYEIVVDRGDCKPINK